MGERVTQDTGGERVLGHGRGIDQELGADEAPVVVADGEHQALVEVVVDELLSIIRRRIPAPRFPSPP